MILQKDLSEIIVLEIYKSVLSRDADFTSSVALPSRPVLDDVFLPAPILRAAFILLQVLEFCARPILSSRLPFSIIKACSRNYVENQSQNTKAVQIS